MCAGDGGGAAPCTGVLCCLCTCLLRLVVGILGKSLELFTKCIGILKDSAISGSHAEC